MKGKSKGRRTDDASGEHADPAARLKTIKVTLHLTIPTAQRLGIESAMRRISQSAIAEEVLSAYLGRWQLPSADDREQRGVG